MATGTARRHDRTRIMVSDFVTVGLVMLAAACTPDSPMAPEASADGQDLTFEWGVFHPAVMIWPGITLRTDAIDVRETFEVPCWPYAGRPSVERAGAVLVLRVTGEPVDGCRQDDTVFSLAYRATISLDGGEPPSEVRVEHRWSDMPDRRYERTLP